MSIPEIIVLRHGETEWNRAGRWQGDLDSPLTEVGRQQAQSMAAALSAAGVGADTHDLFASPLGRARTTAAFVSAAVGIDVIEDARLREISVGQWTGQRADDVMAEAALPEDAPLLSLYEHAPGGEGFEALWNRASGVLEALDRPAVLVTHGITSRFLRTIAMGWTMAELNELPGGQGVIYRVRDGEHTVLGG